MKTLQAFLKVLMSKVQYTPPDTDVIVPFLLLLLTSSMDTRRSPCFAEKDPWSFAIRQKNEPLSIRNTLSVSSPDLYRVSSASHECCSAIPTSSWNIPSRR